MLYCYLKSQACRLLLAADYATGSEDTPSPRAPPLYVGVAAWPGTPAVFAGHLLALLAGDQLPLNRSACDALDQPVRREYVYSRVQMLRMYSRVRVANVLSSKKVTKAQSSMKMRVESQTRECCKS